MDKCILQLLLISTLYVSLSVKGQNEECPRGRCSDGQCPRRSFDRCPEEHCSHRRCEGSLACLTEYRTCPGNPCTHFEMTCADGTCEPWHGHCEDGSIGCIYPNVRRCTFDHCVELLQCCPGQPCPKDAPNRRSDDLVSREDEANYNEPQKYRLLYFIVGGIALILAAVAVLHCLIHICLSSEKDRAGANQQVEEDCDNDNATDSEVIDEEFDEESPRLVEQRHQVINQMQEMNVWSTFHDSFSTHDRIQNQEESVWNRSQEVSDHLPLHSVDHETEILGYASNQSSTTSFC